MKKRILLISAACTSFSFADLVITQSMDGPMKGEMTMTIKGNMMRVDNEAGPAGKVSAIVNVDTMDTTTVMHSQKMVMKMGGAMMKEQMEQAKKMMGGDAKPELKSTGKKEKIGDYECEIYEMTMGPAKSTMWIAKDYPNYAVIKTDMEKLAKQSGQPIPADMPGMALKTETEAMGQKVSMTVKSVKTDSVDDSVFKAPADYKEMNMPTAPAGN